MEETDYIIPMPADEYHAASKSGRYMSSHLLADFRESPELYRRKVNGEITETESAAFILGRAAHCLILEGKAEFEAQYTVSDGPVNIKTGVPYGKTTKAYAEWRAAQKCEIISGKDYSFITKLQKSVLLHPTASELLSDGMAEGVIRTEYCGVPCQIRMDWFSEKYGLVDFKTCESLKWFEADCRRYGYLYQMAFYRAVTRMVTGQNIPVHIIATEKSEPFSTGVWKLTDEVLSVAELSNEAALRKFRQCSFSGNWPTGYEDIRIIDTL